MMKVGITGGIGSGKSTVCKIFEGLGITVYNSDIRAKELMNSRPDIIEQVKKLFGENIYSDQNKLKGKELAAIVFKNKRALEKLNAIVHPAVQQDFERWVMMQNMHLPYILKEAALLVETGSHKLLHYLICVTAPLELRIKRIMDRDHVDRKAVMERINNQLPEQEKVAAADYVIRNDEDSLLIPQILEIHEELSKKSKERTRNLTF